jgi:hypothetical protein
MTLKQVLQAAIVAAFGALSSTEALAQDVIPPLSGQSGRVVILDASGSMRNLSFASPERERMQVARGFLATTFSELADTGDTVPTSLVVFGGDQALTWDSVRTRHGGNPQNYPYTGPLCRDSRVLMPYGTTDARAVGAATTIGNATRWGGMTLIHVSINQALASFDPAIGGQIILISDMDDVNCLPPGVDTLCDAIAPELNEIRRSGGDFSAIVFETPSSTAREALSECVWTTTFPVPVNKPDVKEIVEEALQTVPLTTQVVAGGTGNLDPDGVTFDGGTLIVRPQGRTLIIANGPLGTVELPKGAYTIEGELDGVQWTSSVNLAGPATNRVTVSPSVLGIRTAAAGGGSGPSPIDLTISRTDGRVVARIGSYRSGDQLELANGAYVLTGVDAAGMTATSTVTMALGARRDATLTFGATPAAAAATRDVSINLRYAAPTLDIGQPFNPAVQLSGPGIISQQITTTGFNGGLMPGSYAVNVATPRPHTLPLRVDTGVDRLSVDIVVTPGIFEAETSGRPGTFELRDASGATLFTFIGTQVRHSIVDGTYELLFRRDGASNSQRFTVAAGERTTLRPF